MVNTVGSRTDAPSHAAKVELNLGSGFSAGLENPTFPKHFPQPGAILGSQTDHRQPVFFLDLSQHRQGGFHGSRIALNKQGPEQLEIMGVDLLRRSELSGTVGSDHSADLLGDHIGGDTDHSIRADGHKGQSQ